MSKRTFARADYEIFPCLWRWARRRHRNKNLRWLKEKYFERHGPKNWSFVGEKYDNQGQPHKVRLLLASDTPIQRHVKVKCEANPYDPAFETYFEERDHARFLEGGATARSFRYSVLADRVISAVQGKPVALPARGKSIARWN